VTALGPEDLLRYYEELAEKQKADPLLGVLSAMPLTQRERRLVWDAVLAGYAYGAGVASRGCVPALDSEAVAGAVAAAMRTPQRYPALTARQEGAP